MRLILCCMFVCTTSACVYAEDATEKSEERKRDFTKEEFQGLRLRMTRGELSDAFKNISFERKRISTHWDSDGPLLVSLQNEVLEGFDVVFSDGESIFLDHDGIVQTEMTRQQQAALLVRYTVLFKRKKGNPTPILNAFTERFGKPDNVEGPGKGPLADQTANLQRMAGGTKTSVSWQDPGGSIATLDVFYDDGRGFFGNKEESYVIRLTLEYRQFNRIVLEGTLDEEKKRLAQKETDTFADQIFSKKSEEKESLLTIEEHPRDPNHLLGNWLVQSVEILPRGGQVSAWGSMRLQREEGGVGVKGSILWSAGDMVGVQYVRGGLYDSGYIVLRVHDMEDSVSIAAPPSDTFYVGLLERDEDGKNHILWSGHQHDSSRRTLWRAWKHHPPSSSYQHEVEERLEGAWVYHYSYKSGNRTETRTHQFKITDERYYEWPYEVHIGDNHAIVKRVDADFAYVQRFVDRSSFRPYARRAELVRITRMDPAKVMEGVSNSSDLPWKALRREDIPPSDWELRFDPSDSMKEMVESFQARDIGLAVPLDNGYKVLFWDNPDGRVRIEEVQELPEDRRATRIGWEDFKSSTHKLLYSRIFELYEMESDASHFYQLISTELEEDARKYALKVLQEPRRVSFHIDRGYPGEELFLGYVRYSIEKREDSWGLKLQELRARDFTPIFE